MKKQLLFCLYLMLAICFIGCSKSGNSTENLTGNSKENLTKWAEIYQITLDSYFEQDTVLNSDIVFIAIDLDALQFANDYDKETIVKWFESQYVPVLDTTFDGLRERGLIDEKYSYIPDGFFMGINRVIETDNEIIIYGTRYRGDEGAYGFRSNWLLNNGIWEFSGTVMVWIS
jgi:hypothetical protein